MRNTLVTFPHGLLNLLDNFDEMVKTNIQSRDMKGGVLAFDIKDEGDKYTLHADVPGLTKENITINYERGVLVVETSERNCHEVKEGETLIRTERSSCKKMRSIPLDESVDESKIEANIENGVLSIILPKKENHVAVRKIEVK